jgi:hypothetical protein
LAAEMTESADDTLPAPRSLWELLRSSLGIGVVLGVVAVVAVPAWVCLIGIAPSTVAAVALMRAQLQLAVPGAQPEPVDGTGIGWRWVHAGAWVFVGVAGYIAAVACASALAGRLTWRDPSSDPGTAALTLTLAAGYCGAVTPFAFVPFVILDVRRPHRLSDVLVTSVGLATRDFLPLLGGAVFAGLMLGVPLWLATAYWQLGWMLVWVLAPWLTSGMMVHRYARLSATLPMDPREGQLPTAGVLMLGAWAALATGMALALTHLGTGRGWLAWSGETPGLALVFGVLGLAWVAVVVVLTRAWSRARAVRWVLSGHGSATAAFTGELLLQDGAALVATQAGLRVEGNVWVVGREARLQVPPGVHETPHALELRPDALAPGASVTVVGTFRAIAQPGLRGASLDWPRRASLLVGDYREARATLARRAARSTIALLLPITLLATVTAGALMLDARQNVFLNDPSWFFPR